MRIVHLKGIDIRTLQCKVFNSNIILIVGCHQGVDSTGLNLYIRWIASGQAHFDSEEPTPQVTEEALLADGQQSIDSHIAGNLWQVQVEVGSQVVAGDVLVILESMKMEIPLLAPMAGVVREIRVQPGSPVRAGQRVVVLELD